MDIFPPKPNQLKYKLIETISDCIKAVDEILTQANVIAIDCEGIFLSKEGRLTLLQVKIN